MPRRKGGEEDEAAADAVLAAELGGNLSPTEEAATFTKESTQGEIEAFIEKLFRLGVDLTVQANVNEIIATNTNLGKRELRFMWKELIDEQRRRDRERERRHNLPKAGTNLVQSMDVDGHYKDRNAYIAGRIRDVNAFDPVFFQYMEQFVTADAVRGRIRVLDFGPFSSEVQKIADFHKSKGEDMPVGVAVPMENMHFIFNDAAFRDSLPPLTRVVTTPYFAADGTLVLEPGYHAGAEVYLSPSGLQVTGISPNPTAEEANAAARYVVEEVLADFPLGGLPRGEIMEQAFTGAGVPAVANVMAMILLPFAREMIAGATPLHLINKPAPGTGAGYLVACSTIISKGYETAAMTMAKDQAELAKGLIASLISGKDYIFYDNVSHPMDSPDLASAVTAPVEGYQARILGKTQEVTVKIKVVWIIAANTLTMTDELVRRSTLIDMDARTPNPELRDASKWRHSYIRGWCVRNRIELVRCCLTIIQHWVSEGMNRSAHTKASFEDWAGVMGGILDAAGVPGLMGNDAVLRGDLTNGETDTMGEVVQAIAEIMHNHTMLKHDPRLYIGSKSMDDMAKGKIGIFDVLHGMDGVPRLNWGEKDQYKDGEMRVVYSNKSAASARFNAESKRTRRVMLSDKDHPKGKERHVRFERERDAKAKNWCYRLILTDPAV